MCYEQNMITNDFLSDNGHLYSCKIRSKYHRRVDVIDVITNSDDDPVLATKVSQEFMSLIRENKQINSLPHETN